MHHLPRARSRFSLGLLYCDPRRVSIASASVHPRAPLGRTSHHSGCILSTKSISHALTQNLHPRRSTIPTLFLLHARARASSSSSTSYSDAHSDSRSATEATRLLLHGLANHREAAMSNLRKVIVPALHRLVLARHYAGARELLEAVFSNIEPHEASEQQMNHGIDAEDVNLLILAVSYRPGWKANLPGAASTILNVQEIPSRQGLASLQALLLKKILYSPLEYPANLDTVRLFLWQAAYIDLDMLRDILTLLKRVSQQATSSDDTLSDVSHNPVVPDAEMMHNIMQVYAKHGQHNVAEKWMKVILDAEDSSRREPQSGRRRTSSRRNAKTNSVSDRVQSDGSPSQSFPYWLPLRNEAERPDLSVLLGTTYMSAISRLSSYGSSVDSKKALRIFQEIMKQQRKQGPSNVAGAHPTDGGRLDSHAWNTILSVAAADTAQVSAKDLLEMLEASRNSENLPMPNAITYTIVLSGLVKRDASAEALRVLHETVLPLAGSGLFELDAQVFMSVMDAYSAVEDIDGALITLHFFGKQVTPNDPQSPLPESTSETIYHEVCPTLRGGVQLDVQVINDVLGGLAKAGRFNEFYSLYSEMSTKYGVTPDEVTLAILARTAITAAAWQGRRAINVIPVGAEDALWSDRAPSYSAPDTSQKGDSLWAGVRPHVYVRKLYWDMLKQNYPLLHPDQDTFFTQTKRLFLSFRRKAASPPEIDQDVPRYKTRNATHMLKKPEYHQKALVYPHLVPSQANMHTFIALLGYFEYAYEIPIVLAYMKELDILPARRTLCMAMWRYEESGVYTGQLRRLRQWLIDWIGVEGLPDDEEIGAYRSRQWSPGVRHKHQRPPEPI